MKNHSQKFLQQRRFYMVLPILVAPFITAIFGALGGGQGTVAQTHEMKSGLNFELPGAHFEKETELWNKFSLYEQAKRDSIRYEEARRNDPNYIISTLTGKTHADTLPVTNNLNASLGSKDRYAQINEQEEIINQKLEQLTKQLHQPDTQQANPVKEVSSAHSTNSTPITADVDRLEKMMELMSSSQSTDPEMQQIETMLDKILDVQHPERVQEKLRSQNLQNQTYSYPVSPVTDHDVINTSPALQDSLISTTESLPTQNDFYGLDESIQSPDQGNTIHAVIHETQTVVTGSTIRLRLLSDVQINGHFIPKDHFLFGSCTFQGERLLVSINNIQQNATIFPVALSAYDINGTEGLYVPGTITRDAATQTSSQSVQDIQLYSMDNSLEVQAASTGIEAAKGLFEKKTKRISVTVKAGHQVLLLNKQ